jgi:dTDP-4-amino-4,6-dideoxygalactose transaminase
MGSCTGILYQGLVPRFADINPRTYNMDPASTRSLISDRTGAILLVHHSGLAAPVDEFVQLAQEFNIPLVEDCAQAWYTKYNGQLVGTFGDISAFSLNHFKIITCGSGGLVLTNRDDLEDIAKLFVDKCYFRDGRKRNPYFLAPNYQMSELQGAVAVAQLDKVQDIVQRRNELGMRLLAGLGQIDGVIPQEVPQGCQHSFFLTVVRLDPEAIPTPIPDFCTALTAEGIPNEPNKITGGMATYLYDVFQNQAAFFGSKYPFVSEDLGTNVSYPQGTCPVAEEAFEHTFNLSITEFFTEQDIDEMVDGVRKVADAYRVS